jgi:hypothetical protein
MRARRSVALAAVVLSVVVVGCWHRKRAAAIPQLQGYRPQWRELSSEICIERPENAGVVNVREAVVFLTVPQSFTLTGGQAICTFVAPGSYSMMASSRDPFDPTSDDPKGWTSETLTVETKPGEVVQVQLVQRNAPSPGWTLVRVGGAK